MSSTITPDHTGHRAVVASRLKLADPAQSSPDDDELEEYDEYDIPTERGFIVETLLLPWNLLLALVSTVFDILGLIPYFFKCLAGLIGDLAYTAHYFGTQLWNTFARLILAPLHFALTDPLGFVLHLIDRVFFLAWALRWFVRSLWRESWEQVRDTGNLCAVIWQQSLESLSLVPASPSPFQGGSARTGPVRNRITPPKMRSRPVSPNRQSTFVLVPGATNKVGGAEAKSDAPVAHPVFKPSSRTKLADPDTPIDPDEIADDHALRAAHGSSMGADDGSHYKCPSCQSEEVYAVRSDGRFAESPKDFGLVIQHMFCERCTVPFRRPGRLFLVAKPIIRPKDTELYD